MTNVATLRGLLLCCETCGQLRFINFPEDGRLAAGRWWIITFDVSAGRLLLGKHTFMVNYGNAAARRIFEGEAGKALLAGIVVDGVQDTDKLHAGTGIDTLFLYKLNGF